MINSYFMKNTKFSNEAKNGEGEIRTPDPPIKQTSDFESDAFNQTLPPLQMVPKERFELSRAYAHSALNAACLPVSPLRLSQAI